ncbi:MAG: right-handed parallel beta-helix repeat-containing protein, partial [Planctomycetota bacterium]
HNGEHHCLQQVEGQGGGIKCTKGGVISNNVICYNTAEMTPSSQYGIGGGVLVENGDAVRIINSLIYKNSAARYGGGLYIYGGADLYFSHLTMVGNSATEGSGIYASGQAQMSITNSIIRNEGANEIYSESTSPAVANSNVKGGWPGVSIIDADPLFVDESENDFHLLYDSPCLNTGSNGHTAGDTDFEGDPRIAYDMADMGADEFHPHLYYKGTSAPCSRVDIRVVGLPDTASVGIFVGSGVLDPPLPTAWGLFYLQSPYFLYKLPAIPSNGVLSFNVMIPVSIPAPSTLPLQAIIGEGEDALSNLCIMEIKE